MTVNPTTIDTANHHNRIKDQYTDKVTIGWTGTHSTLKYLALILSPIQELEKIYHFDFVVIADKKPDFQLKSLRFIKWNKQTEIEDLLRINIGLMPLSDDPWTNGKCGFKALQFMALGIPALASPVGVNYEIIDDGENGFLCRSENEWLEKLKLLLKNRELRYLMGQKGRKRVEENFSVDANRENFLSLFR